jgi:predicted ArsR family transcriptional regulator
MYQKVTSEQIYTFIQARVACAGSPTVLEIAAHFGVSKTTVRNHLLGLLVEGKVKWRVLPGRRAITLADAQ